MKKIIFREVRFSLYLTFIICGIILWRFPITYQCNITNETCFGCGLRRAVDLLLKCEILESYYSNKFIVLVVLIVMFMAVDVVIYIYKRQSKHI